MKRLFLSITFLLLLLQLSAQMLTMDQAISYRTKSVGAFEEIMSKRKYELLSIKKPEGLMLGTISFAYNKGVYDNKAESFITLIYSDIDIKNNRLVIQVNSNKSYNIAISKIKAIGGKLIDSSVEEEAITKVYKINNTIIKVETKTIVDDLGVTKNVYAFILYSEKDYTLHLNAKSYSTNSELDTTAAELDTTSAIQLSPEEEEKYNEASKLRDEAIEHFNKEEYKEAIPKFLTVLKGYILSNLDYYYLAYSYYSLGKYSNAIKHVNTYLQKEPRSVDGLFILSQSNFLVNNIKLAIQAQKKLCEISDSAHNNITLSWYLFLDKKYASASDYLSKAEEQLENSNDDLYHIIQMNKAHLYLMQGKYQTAKLIYTKYKGYLIENETWEELVMEDFEVMKKYKLINPDIEKIKAVLRQD